MAVQIHGGVGSRLGDRRRRRQNLMSEINVTPFVDVMLVLLVIFMVAAPLLTTGIQVDLPDTNTPAMEGKDEPLSVSVGRDGTIYIEETETTLKDLKETLDAITNNRQDLRLFIHGDDRVSYGEMMDVVGAINAAGYSKIGLVTQPEK